MFLVLLLMLTFNFIHAINLILLFCFVLSFTYIIAVVAVENELRNPFRYLQQ